MALKTVTKAQIAWHLETKRVVILYPKLKRISLNGGPRIHVLDKASDWPAVQAMVKAHYAK